MTLDPSKFLPVSIIEETTKLAKNQYIDYLTDHVASQFTYLTYQVLVEVIPFEKETVEKFGRLVDPLALLKPKLVRPTTIATEPKPPATSGLTTRPATGALAPVHAFNWDIFQKQTSEELKEAKRFSVLAQKPISGATKPALHAKDRVDTEYKELVTGTKTEPQIRSELNMRDYRTFAYPSWYVVLAALFHVQQQKNFIGMRFLATQPDTPPGRFLETLFPNRNAKQALLVSPLRLFTPYLNYLVPVEELIGEPEYLRKKLHWFDRLNKILEEAKVASLPKTSGKPTIPRAPNLTVKAMEDILVKTKSTDSLFCGPEWNITNELASLSGKVPYLNDFLDDKKDSSIFYIVPVMFPPRITVSANAILHETVLEQLILFFQNKCSQEFETFNANVRRYTVGKNYQVDIRITYLADLFARILETRFYFEFPGPILASLRILPPHSTLVGGTTASVQFYNPEIEAVFEYFKKENLENVRDFGTFLVIFKYLYTIYYYCKKEQPDIKVSALWTKVLTKDLCQKILQQVRVFNDANTNLTAAPAVRMTLSPVENEDEVAERAKLWQNVGDYLQDIKRSKEEEKKIKAQAELAALIQIKSELSTKELEEKTKKMEEEKEAIATAEAQAVEKKRKETLKVISWNVLSHHLMTPNPEEINSVQDPANPIPFYEKITRSVPEEHRMIKLKHFLFAMTRDSAYMPDFLCLQQVSVEFAYLIFPSFIASNSTVIYTPYWDSNYQAIFIPDEVAPLQKLSFAGKQGILLMWNSNEFELKPQHVQHFPSPFGYYFGTGSTQLFALFTRKSATTNNSLLFCASQGYPQSWPLLSLSPKKMENISGTASISGGTQILTLLFMKPSIYYQKTYVDLQKAFDAKEILGSLKLPDWIHNTFKTERPILPENETCSTTPRYTEYDVARYRFLIYTARERIPVPPDLSYIRREILSLTANTFKLPEVEHHWKHFNPGFNILILLDSIYIAESESLFFNERLETMNTTYEPSQILACLTFPYNTAKTRLSEYAAGYGAKWINSLKRMVSNDNKVRLTSVLPKDTPTWWLPSFIDKCTELKESNTNVGCETGLRQDKGSISSCTLLNNAFNVVQYGIIADHILYKSGEVVDLEAEQEYEDRKAAAEGLAPIPKSKSESSTFQLTDIKLKVYETKGTKWGQSDKVDLAEYLSDHLALEATFQWSLS